MKNLPISVTETSISIFVFGDLVLDHTIFVKRKNRPHQRVGDEKIYEVIRRMDTAGGAANCARALAALSRGRTFLWGVTGVSPWGSFASVLRNAQILDCAISPIVLWSHHDEALPMNTITRVIREDGGQRHHEYRFDDVGHPPNENAVTTSAAYLQNAEKLSGTTLKAIIINDLDMHALPESLLTQISDFAQARQISLFIDPKRNIDRYRDVHATAILPNLDEWCAIIGEPDRADFWRGSIKSREGLRRMAGRSIKALPNFTFHVIKADKDGAVLVGPAPGKIAAYNISHILPHPTNMKEELSHQLGCGDVLAALLALEYAASNQPDNSVRFRKAYEIANAVVAAYREMPWHRMPRREDIAHLKLSSPAPHVDFVTVIPERFISNGDVVDLTDLYTDIPDFLSSYPVVHETIRNLITFLREQWKGVMLSAILTAEGGSGKSLLFKALPQILLPTLVWDISKDTDTATTKNRLQKLIASKATRSIFMIDEAFKRIGRILHKESGVLLLEQAHSAGKRFLFVDADFQAHEKNLSESQFLGRCQIFMLPKFRERPSDIVPIFAHGCLNAAQVEGMEIQRVRVNHEVLLNIIEWTLTTARSPRDVSHAGESAVRNALAESTIKSAMSEVRVSLGHLRDIPRPQSIIPELQHRELQFFRSARQSREKKDDGTPT